MAICENHIMFGPEKIIEYDALENGDRKLQENAQQYINYFLNNNYVYTLQNIEEKLCFNQQFVQKFVACRLDTLYLTSACRNFMKKHLNTFNLNEEELSVIEPIINSRKVLFTTKESIKEAIRYFFYKVRLEKSSDPDIKEQVEIEEKLTKEEVEEIFYEGVVNTVALKNMFNFKYDSQVASFVRKGIDNKTVKKYYIENGIDYQNEKNLNKRRLVRFLLD